MLKFLRLKKWQFYWLNNIIPLRNAQDKNKDINKDINADVLLSNLQ